MFLSDSGVTPGDNLQRPVWTKFFCLLFRRMVLALIVLLGYQIVEQDFKKSNHFYRWREFRWREHSPAQSRSWCSGVVHKQYRNVLDLQPSPMGAEHLQFHVALAEPVHTKHWTSSQGISCHEPKFDCWFH